MDVGVMMAHGAFLLALLENFTAPEVIYQHVPRSSSRVFPQTCAGSVMIHLLDPVKLWPDPWAARRNGTRSTRSLLRFVLNESV